MDDNKAEIARLRGELKRTRIAAAIAAAHGRLGLRGRPEDLAAIVMGDAAELEDLDCDGPNVTHAIRGSVERGLAAWLGAHPDTGALFGAPTTGPAAAPKAKRGPTPPADAWRGEPSARERAARDELAAMKLGATMPTRNPSHVPLADVEDAAASPTAAEAAARLAGEAAVAAAADPVRVDLRKRLGGDGRGPGF